MDKKTRVYTEKEIIDGLELSIHQLVKPFRGEGAFYFFKEEDIRCRLFNALTKNLRDPEIIHGQQFRCSDGTFGDLVIWRPELKEKAKELLWGRDYTKIDEIMPNLTLAAIEIVHLYGGVGKAGTFAHYSSCKDDPDIIKLVKGVHHDNTTKYGYFLLFWDEDISEDDFFDYKVSMDTTFKKLHQRFGIRSCCISRERLEFTHGFTGIK